MNTGTDKKIILLVINSLQGGGAERSVLTLGQGFFELGFAVHVIRFDNKVEYDLSDDLTFHLLEFSPFKRIPIKTLRYRYFAKKLDDYVVNTVGMPILTLSNLDRADRVMRYSQLPNIAYIIRNTISKKIELLQNKKSEMSVKSLTKVYAKHPCIGISHGVTADISQTLGVTKTATIYNPIDKHAIIELASKYVPSEKNYMVHVGSFKTQKAHETLIRAYALSNKTIPLLLVGKGALFEKIQALVKELDIDEHVEFVGFKKNPYPYIKHAKFLVLSSNFEGFGRVIAEALALDVPVISTDCPSGPSEMLPSKNLVTVGDIDALSFKINEAMRDAGQFSTTFDDNFAPENIAKSYLEYMQVTSVD